MRFLAFVGSATLVAAWLATGCASSEANDPTVPGADVSAATQDLAEPAPWCPTPKTLTTADSPADYLPPVEVQLEEVLDGDTAYFRLPSGVVERIRFMHINAEEVAHDNAGPHENGRATAFGEITKDHVHERLRRAQSIAIAPHRDPRAPTMPEADAFGRWLALIWVDGELLQQQLIADGYSGYYTKYGCAQGGLHDVLLWSEALANQKNRGVWDPQYGSKHLPVLSQWIGVDACRPNPLKGQFYCPGFQDGQPRASGRISSSD